MSKATDNNKIRFVCEDLVKFTEHKINLENVVRLS